MFQDIAPHTLFNQYKRQEPTDGDMVIVIQKDSVYCRIQEQNLSLPKVSMFEEKEKKKLIYLLSVDEQAFFWLDMPEKLPMEELFGWQDKFKFRGKEPEELAYATAVAFHLANWYNTNRFCGHCGARFEHSAKERALICPQCRNRKYPQICPAAIVGILNHGKILLSKYADGYYRRHALIAGYSEIGETMEETIHREVMEETGLKVKNIRYFGSQPWPFTGSLLFGFFAELDGDDKVVIDDEELAEAEWFDREHLPREDNTLSLTWTMIEYFRNHPEID